MEEKFETIILVKQTFYRGVIYLLHNFGRGEKRIPVLKCLLLSAQFSITAELTAANGREKRLSLKVGVLVFLISFCYRNENEKREKNKLKAKNGSNLN